jgi:Tfp pilus assembly protein PilN
MSAVFAGPQQVNLYDASLLPPRHPFTVRQLLAWVLISALALGGIAWWARGQIGSLRQEMAQQQAARPRAPGAGPTQQQVTGLEQALRARTALLEARRAAREALERGMARPDAGPSAVLRRIADTIPPSAWLLELRVAGSHVDIRAKALDPAAVDAWLERLRASRFLAERPAPTLRLDRIDPPAGSAETVPVYAVQLSAALEAPFADEGARP